ncbi:ABC transporter ATP-binding protein [Terrisporobacter mayombei]|uniref:Bacitracin export ATP-binding protein BceA n=1 Tax=Terrisporobacter mayombei TaxID=1541 RepID=A0ABY9PXP5_9FIRM|nr:ABC transporter ATP-binding protein [Terrisporobacter mayombei]MCC3868008.1 ABC transporter ATP-binding protein [Terrisporobacter mayombei]WMT80144.1 Bacitracin export ATP-binding protein BceA [Terrisporobacter mayombei]
MAKKILEVQSLKKYYGKKDNITKAIDGITFQIIDGEFVGIMGSSGSGKTTLLNCIATTTSPTEGKILLKGEDIASFKGNKLAYYRGNRIGYLFQNFELIDNLNARENIMLPIAIHNMMGKEDEKRIDELVKYLEIQDVMTKFPSEMSGGQKQRVAAARALILNPEIVLADEPTGALDSKNAKLLMEKLSGLNEEQNRTILMVTHDANAASYCSRILFIQDGLVFHELRRRIPEESQQEFYKRIISVMAQLGGGSANVL